MVRGLILAVCLSMVSAARGQNLVANGGFENGLEGWHQHLSGEAKVEAAIDATVAHSGRASYRIANGSPFSPQVYFRIFQHVPVKPNTAYRIGLWCKGSGVGRCWVGGGPQWLSRTGLPAGDYDWRFVTIDYTTGPEQTGFELIVLTESQTQSLWIDDLMMVEAASNEGVFTDSRVWSGLEPALRFYPAVHRESGVEPPVVRMRSDQDKDFGFDVRMTWDQEGVHLDLDVLDPTRSPIIEGLEMWYSDSIQLGLDTDALHAKEGYGATGYELGFALGDEGKVLQYAWHAGGLDQYQWRGLPVEGRRSDRGYRMSIVLPWTVLRVDPSDPPEVLAVNVLVNDGQETEGRRWVEWTEGIGWGVKTPNRFARVVLVDRAAPPSVGHVVFDGSTVVDRHEPILGRYVEYAFGRVPQGRVNVAGLDEAGQRVADWGVASVPAANAGQVRSFGLALPAEPLVDEGEYRLAATLGVGDAQRVTAETLVIRQDLSARLQELVEANAQALSRIRERLADRPDLQSNRYVELGVTLAERFLKRVADGGPNGNQTIDWSMLQMRELADVLGETQAFVDAALGSDGPPVDSPRLAPGPIIIRDGVFCAPTRLGDEEPEERPFFFGGFGHFGSVGVEVCTIGKLGFSVIQQECGPSSLWGEGNLDHIAQSRVDAAKRASSCGMKVDFLLSPHYFPEWATSEAPDVILDGGGWNKFNVNHPVARQAIARWIDVILGRHLKDESSLMSVCLMNEPSYGHSGRDEISRPLWTEYLKNKHQTVEALNQVYETSYASFDEVPPPSGEAYKDPATCRAFHDWAMFNNENFAQWHRFMHEQVKQAVPGVYTHSKILDAVFRYGVFGAGTDPELICEVTDLAGNDCWALYGAGPYAWNWRQMELWYDLLHSFRNQPVINTENHLIPDGSTTGDRFPPRHTYAALWQGGLHHQGSHAIWTWEEPVSPGLVGHMSLRPASLFAAGRAMLDLNRLAEPVAAINRAPARVGLLYSMSSIIWQKDIEETIGKVYAGLTFSGLPITFVSERQLAAGTVKDVPLIVLPRTTHVWDSTVEALARFVEKGGTIIAAGDDCLRFDEYNRRRELPAGLQAMERIAVGEDDRSVAEPLRAQLVQKGLLPAELVDVQTGKAVWGVEYRCVAEGKGLLIPMINMLKGSQTVRLNVVGEGVDLIARQPVSLGRIELQPMVPVLLRIEPPDVP
ncbi:MAG: hypothetical protein GXY33_07255 [Phycisphaerae bacterium]|nr:hypothetical protein [Phycisphaerae bacterium]